MLYSNFRSIAFLSLLGFLIWQLKNKHIPTLLSAAKFTGDVVTYYKSMSLSLPSVKKVYKGKLS